MLELKLHADGRQRVTYMATRRYAAYGQWLHTNLRDISLQGALGTNQLTN